MADDTFIAYGTIFGEHPSWLAVDLNVIEEPHGDHSDYTYGDPPRVIHQELDDSKKNPIHLYTYNKKFYLANDALNGFTQLDPLKLLSGGDGAKGVFFRGGGGHITLAAVDNKVAYSTWIGQTESGKGKVDVVDLNKPGTKSIAYSFESPYPGLHGAIANSGRVFLAPADGIVWVDADTKLSQSTDTFDVTFLIMAIAPLVVIGLTFNVSSHDQESNLQSLIIAQTPSLGRLMAVRCFVRAGLAVLLVACIVNGTLLFSFGSQFDFKVVLSLLVWNVVAAAYLLLWAAFSLFVNSFARSSLANGTALLLLWLILVLLIPKFASYAVEESISTLPESELIEREKLTLDDIEKRSDELLQRFQSKHPELEIDSDDEQQINLVKYLLNHREAGNRASENVSAHYSAQSLRASYLSYCAWLSPAISFRIQSDRSAGNSEPAFIAFSARVAEVQAHGRCQRF